jgi:hypothetical protein
LIKFIFDATGKKTDLSRIPRFAENAGIPGSAMNFSVICSRSFPLLFPN